MLAAYGGHNSCLELLLPASDPLAQDKYGWTALMHTAHYGRESCAQLLLPVSDILAKNAWEQTASEIATVSGHASLATLIDAYAYAQGEKLALNSVIPTGAKKKRSSLRV